MIRRFGFDMGLLRFGACGVNGAAVAIAVALLSIISLGPQPAHAARDLFVVLKFPEPTKTSVPFRFVRPATSVSFVSGGRNLKKFLAKKDCKAGESGLKRCHLIETVGRKEAGKCVAVLLDSDAREVKLSDIRIRRGNTLEAAARKVFFGSQTYNNLYFAQRLIGPFRTVTVIDEYVFTDGESWKDEFLGSACRK